MNEVTKKAIIIEAAKKAITVKTMDLAIEDIRKSLEKHVLHRGNTEKEALQLLWNFGSFSSIPNEKEIVRMVKKYGAEEIMFELDLKDE